MDQCQNNTIRGFHIMGFTMSGTESFPKFIVFFLMYLISVIGNMLIALLVCKVPRLHTPMYFFLSNLSIVDATYVSAILPKLLSITLMEHKAISFEGCFTQLYFFVFCADAEICILICMAYDRYVAVCSPLHYSMMMRKSVCAIMSGCSFVVSALNSLLLTLLTSTLSFCSSHNINHFFCEIRSLIILSTSDTTSAEMVLFVEDICFIFSTFVLIMISYVCIIHNVFKIRSSEGRLKTFSSCTSHLISVILFYGPIIFLYIKPKPKDSMEENPLVSLLYVAVVPTLNPFVYTLRNKKVIGVIVKIIKIKSSSLVS
uniref:Olfactory receptor n=1 Tax=Pyxicephalus adspersus TaxID=30357 RepID=A0AAV3B5A6_PYXAD|nr:TPA: hypothetical protein GDO54_006230 [Pyxicephalus adspersus]